MSLQVALEMACIDPVKASTHYVVLAENAPYYGGGEEGGWWGNDHIIHAYKEYPSRELAEQAAEQAKQLAEELSKDSRDAHGDYCLRTMAWIDARGLDADYFPEVDGESEYVVYVTESIPENSYGSRQYC